MSNDELIRAARACEADAEDHWSDAEHESGRPWRYAPCVARARGAERRARHFAAALSTRGVAASSPSPEPG